MFVFFKTICIVFVGLIFTLSSEVSLAKGSANSERELADLKSSLLEYALDNKAYVSANSWISSSGSMKEELLVYSALKFDKLRFQTFDYGKGNRGSRLFGFDQRKMGERFSFRNRSNKESMSCDLPALRKQRLELTLENPQGTDSISLNLANHSNQILLDSIKGESRDSLFSQNIIIYEPRRAGSAYTSYYAGRYRGPADLKAVISSNSTRLVVKKALKNSIRPWKKSAETFLVETRISLTNQGGRELWTDVFYSRVSAPKTQILLTRLSDPATAEIKTWARSVVPTLIRQAQCFGPVALSMANSKGSKGGSIVGGKSVGLFKGQKFLLTPREDRFALDGLERGLGMVSLAEVVSVFENTASVDVYAGLSPDNYNDMLAIPLSHSGIFEG